MDLGPEGEGITVRKVSANFRETVIFEECVIEKHLHIIQL